MRRFYAPPENFQAKTVSLSPEETRHLRDVLRLRESETVSVFDGTGREFSCRITQIKKAETVLEIIEEASPTPISNLDLTLAVALLKGEKFDLVIQKAVELGVSKFIPITTKRTDVRLKDSGKRNARWQKIALEAAKQSGRADLMKIEPPLSFEQFLAIAPSATKILFAERGGETFSKIKKDKKITAVIGPEGGWDSSEIESAKMRQFQIVTLGGRIQRAETAAISIAAILQHRFGDLN